MENITYGYARVSTQEQNETRQITAMREFGVEEKNIGDRINLSVFSVFQWNIRIQICYFAYGYSTGNICI